MSAAIQQNVVRLNISENLSSNCHEMKKNRKHKPVNIAHLVDAVNGHERFSHIELSHVFREIALEAIN
jgi:hypothetical protein